MVRITSRMLLAGRRPSSLAPPVARAGPSAFNFTGTVEHVPIGDFACYHGRQLHGQRMGFWDDASPSLVLGFLFSGQPRIHNRRRRNSDRTGKLQSAKHAVNKGA